MLTRPTIPVALFAAAHAEDTELGAVLERAFAVPVLTCVAPRARLRTPRRAPATGGRDLLVDEAYRRALVTMDALPQALQVLAVSEAAEPDPDVPGRWLTRLVVVRLERTGPDGPVTMRAADARIRRPLASAAAAHAARTRLVARAARSLVHHGACPCPQCGHPGFGALDACVACRASARGERQTRNSERRASSWMARTAGWVSFRSTEMA